MKKRYHNRLGGKSSHPVPKSPSLVAEWDALRLFGDRTSRVILAIFHARRCAQTEEFFVAPHIAKFNNLSPKDLNWALDRLERKLVVTRSSKKGKWRMIRLLPQFEEAVRTTAIQGTWAQEAADDLQANEERVTYDREYILGEAASSNNEMSPAVIKTLRQIASRVSDWDTQ